MEERSVEAWRLLHCSGSLGREVILEIRNPVSTYAKECDSQIDRRRAEYIALGGNDGNIRQETLFCRSGDIENIYRTVAGSQDIAIDISCMPKRFFFLLLKLVLEKSAARNVMVTYTHPERYLDEGPLAEDPEPWTCLPGYLPNNNSAAPTALVVAIGYEPLGLPQILEAGDFRHDELRILLPFPSPGTGFERNWRFVMEIARRRNSQVSSIVRLDNRDISAAFDVLQKITGNGATNVALAPFGPKPISVAMCLYALACGASNRVPVYYTQPRSYSPRYSTGVRRVNGRSEVYGYMLRLDGRSLYTS